MFEADDWLALAEAPGIGAVRWGALMRGELAAADATGLVDRARAATSRRQRSDLRARCRDLGIEILSPAHGDWPSALRALADPPAVLFARGSTALLSAPQIAIVGARRASRRGLADAAWFAADLARAGLTVTSGLALGIDGAAHVAALESAGTTVAVLGGGLDRVYPARHRHLARRIVERGLLLSEFPPGTAPAAHHFPRRNRVISGLARGVLVIEAGERSGSMITARLAAEQGREVFAVPGPVRDANAAGCLRLLREGACLARSARDVLDELGLAPAPEPDPAAGPVDRAAEAGPVAGSEAARVLDAIDDAGTAFDVVVARTALAPARLAALITELELDGRIALDADRLFRLHG
ncbi:MAG TPA: DNA-processing protein DprA [Pseudomonadales bacterium]|nr:DNA-processing protein DprA [Pseudomonadales bacterium]